MPSRRILLTGATGFIGSEVFCRLYKNTDAEIHLLGRRRPSLERGLFADRLREHGLSRLDPKRVHVIETDFSKASVFGAALAALPGNDWTVVHLAAFIHAKGERAEQERVNIGVTQDLLNWLNVRGGHFVFASSVVAFGGSRWRRLRSEKDFPAFPAPSRGFGYFETKRIAHEAVLTAAKVPATVLCPGVVHGALEHYKDSRGHLKALREGRLNLAPPGGNSFISLGKVAAGIVEAAVSAPPAQALTRLLVDRNLDYSEYFKLYVELARGARAQKIHRVPPAIGGLARVIFKVCAKFGLHLSPLEGLAQGSLFLSFRSEWPMPEGPSLEEALRAALEKPN